MCDVNDAQSGVQHLHAVAVIKEEMEVDFDELALNSEEIKVGKMTLRVRSNAASNGSLEEILPQKKTKIKSGSDSGKQKGKGGSVNMSTKKTKPRNKHSKKVQEEKIPEQKSNNLVTKLKDLLSEFCESNCQICDELISKLNQHVTDTENESAHDLIQGNSDPLEYFDDVLMDFQAAEEDDNETIKIEYPQDDDDIIPSVSGPDPDLDLDSPRVKRKKRERNQDKDHEQPEDDHDPDLDLPEANHKSLSLPGYNKKRKGRRAHTRRTRCPLCDKKFTYQEDLDQHLNKSHSISASDSQALTSEERKKRWETQVMDKVYQLIGGAGADAEGGGASDAQTQAHAQDITFTCPGPECGLKFRSTRALTKHYQENHPTAPKLSYNCSICNSEFELMCYLKMHVEKVHCSKEEREKSSKFKCQIPTCGKSFKLKTRLETHIKVNHPPDGGSPFTCPFPTCGKVCRTKRLLRTHRMTHDPIKNFMCDICSKCFRTNAELTRHKVTLTNGHGGERLHVCDQCGKAFGENSILKTHYRIHTGEKKYKCQVCGEKFMFRAGLRDHVKKLHD